MSQIHSREAFLQFVLMYYTGYIKTAHRENIKAGFQKIVGYDKREKLFRKSVMNTVEGYGGTEGNPYPTARKLYQQQCIEKVYPATRKNVLQGLRIRIERNHSLPSSDQVRRNVFRKIVGKAPYYAILHSIGGYFELKLVLDAWFSAVETEYTEKIAQKKGCIKVQPEQKKEAVQLQLELF